MCAKLEMKRNSRFGKDISHCNVEARQIIDVIQLGRESRSNARKERLSLLFTVPYHGLTIVSRAFSSLFHCPFTVTHFIEIIIKSNIC